MKKFFFIVAAATLVFASCAKNEIVTNPDRQKAVAFSVYAGNAVSKGLVTDNADPSATATASIRNGFGILAYYTDNNPWNTTTDTSNPAPNFMYNQLVTSASTGSNPTWTYSPVKYWPTEKTDYLSFFAYAPHNNENSVLSTNATAGTPTITFTVNTDITKQTDLVADVAIDQQHDATGNGITTDKAVNFQFKHELSRLGFTAVLDETITAGTDTSVVVIKSITLNSGGQFYSTAEYTWANTNDASGSTAGTGDSRGKWSDHTIGTFNISSAFKTNLAANTKVWSEENEESKPAGPTYNTPVLVLTGADGADTDSNPDPVNLLTDNHYMFLIPVEGGTTAGNAQCTIEYDIVTKDYRLSNKYSLTPAKKVVNLPTGILKQGKAYNVNFTIYIDKIVVTADVVGWDETELSKPVDVPHSPDSPVATTQP